MNRKGGLLTLMKFSVPLSALSALVVLKIKMKMSKEWKQGQLYTQHPLARNGIDFSQP